MSFWNFWGLPSKRDNEILEAKLEKLHAFLINDTTNKQSLIETTAQKSFHQAEELNQEIVMLLNEMKVSFNETVIDGNEDIIQNLGKQEKHLKKLEPLIKQSHGYIFETLSTQNKQIQQLEDKIQYLEKLNEELVKSMQAVWLVQLSQQIDSGIIEK